MELNCPKDHWTLQWKSLNLYDAGVGSSKKASFEGSGYLGCENLMVIMSVLHVFLCLALQLFVSATSAFAQKRKIHTNSVYKHFEKGIGLGQ